MMAIEVSSPKELPAGVITTPCHSLEEAQKWANGKGVCRFWYYPSKIQHVIIVAVIKTEARPA